MHQSASTNLEYKFEGIENSLIQVFLYYHCGTTVVLLAMTLIFGPRGQ